MANDLDFPTTYELNTFANEHWNASDWPEDDWIAFGKHWWLNAWTEDNGDKHLTAYIDDGVETQTYAGIKLM